MSSSVAIVLHQFSAHPVFHTVEYCLLCSSSPTLHQLVTSYPAAKYADDTQLFIAVRAATIQSDLSVIEACSTSVQQWFAINELLLNPDKSEVIFFSTNAQLKATATIDVVVDGGSSLPVATELKSLGVVLDSRLSFDAHVTAACRACNYHLWALRHIRQLLTDDVARTLA